MTASIIDAAVTKLSEGSNKASRYASLVQKAQDDHVCHRMLTVVRMLKQERREANAANANRQADPDLNGVDDHTSLQTAETVLKPEYMFTFIQKVANQVMREGRAIKRQQEESEMEARDNGIDFSQDTCEDAGVEYGDVKHVIKQIDEAMRQLHLVYNALRDTKRLGYLTSINSLHYHSVMTGEDGVYEEKFVADTFDEALVALADYAQAMQEQSEARGAEDDGAIDFEADAA
tara:strand:- start:349 stop:1047 length:699 start_codon:yes stop_codon:yes gene_type:complete